MRIRSGVTDNASPVRCNKSSGVVTMKLFAPYCTMSFGIETGLRADPQFFGGNGVEEQQYRFKITLFEGPNGYVSCA